MIATLLQRIYKSVYEAVFPTCCLACGSFFHSAPDVGKTRHSVGPATNRGVPVISRRLQLNHLLAPFLCPACLTEVLPVESPICTCCGMPFKGREGEDHLCGECLTSPKEFRMARAPLVYDQILSTVVHRYKYRGKVQLAGPLGGLLLATFSRFWAPHSIDVVVPVPLHWRRLRSRGFNQAFLLLRNWDKLATACHVDLSDVEIQCNLLVRTALTAPQTGLGRKERMTNIKNAFEVRSQEKISDKAILLVDDVYTTGATVNECARLLLRAGAKLVDVLTLARAI